ncbi:hypothetical protein SUGI_1176580 [Cryptomeria japonica]|uniref:uncharacterized protein LOC131859948 n=1 Tax=Cryptomeria japonica TaxID=3369 RepID=UPI002414CD04|nr:uncharacterized protein LOC131859948 [Cryptomeria japonica]GLJ54775.1 hypothetical protein SUGI_1176580 [Cryptomeria japonica]
MFATAIRCLSRRARPRIRPTTSVEPNIPLQDRQIVCRVIYDIVREYGPLPVAQVWDHVEVAGLRALTSKMQMKSMLKWMREKKMLKIISNPGGSCLPCLYSLGYNKP